MWLKFENSVNENSVFLLGLVTVAQINEKNVFTLALATLRNRSSVFFFSFGQGWLKLMKTVGFP